MPACVKNVRKSTLGLGIKVKLNQALMIIVTNQGGQVEGFDLSMRLKGKQGDKGNKGTRKKQGKEVTWE